MWHPNEVSIFSTTEFLPFSSPFEPAGHTHIVFFTSSQLYAQLYAVCLSIPCWASLNQFRSFPTVSIASALHPTRINRSLLVHRAKPRGLAGPTSCGSGPPTH